MKFKQGETVRWDYTVYRFGEYFKAKKYGVFLRCVRHRLTTNDPLALVRFRGNVTLSRVPLRELTNRLF